MENKYNLLLQDIQAIINKQDDKIRQSGGRFNLLEVADINDKEVKMCRILAELLNPNGAHYSDCLFLKDFISDVLGISMTDKELSSAAVSTEYVIDASRRIDIVIQTSVRFIPIEVKIYAADQPKQCGDYYDFAKKKNEKYPCKVYYLTLDGHLPQDAEALEDKVVLISFRNDICVWLDKCLVKIQDKQELYYAAKQYNDALKGLCGNMKNEEIIKAISQNSSTMRAACSIHNSLDYCKTDMLKKLFCAIDEKFNPSDFGLSKRIENEYDYRYDNYKVINEYYKYKGSTYPGITYKYKKIDDNTEIWFRIEVDWHLYCGFVVAVDGKHPEKIDDNLLCKCRDYIVNRDDWWCKWVYLPNKASAPNFKDLNDGFYNLFDEQGFNDTVEQSIKEIGNFLSENCKDWE